MTNPGICPHCSAELPSKAIVCTRCGSDIRTGWSEISFTNDDILENDEYSDLLQKTFPHLSKPKNSFKKIILSSITLILLILFIIHYVF